jgi:tyrosyl-tRNA synthetase
MHLGNYLTLTLIKRLSKNGHKVYGIVGGITGLIGDPKPSAERQMQEVATINYNAQCLAKQFKEIGGAYEVINNMDFYDNMKI